MACFTVNRGLRKGEKLMKKTYSSPELEKLMMSAEDILEGSGETAENENLFDTSELF